MNRSDLKQRRAQRRALTFKFDKPLSKFHKALSRSGVKLAPVDYTLITPSRFHSHKY